MLPLTTLSSPISLCRLTLALAIGVLFSAPASAGPIPFDEWLQFGFTETGTPATGCDPADPAGPFCVPSSGTPSTFLDAPPWTFTASGAGATLRITDAFFSGDRFEIFDFGVSLGLTSLPTLDVDCGDDPVPCFANAAMSTGLFALAAGNHSLTIVPVAALDGGGSGYFQVEGTAAVVPEPATLTLLATGLVLSVRRRRAS
jgi:hypothetical protein